MFPFAATRKAGPVVSRAGDQGLLTRAPGLREASDRVVVSIVKGLQTMAGTATTIEGMVAGFAMEKARDTLAAHKPHMAAGAIALKELSASLLVTLDATLVHGLIELLCGGNGAEAPAVEPRTATPIDQQFALILVTLLASAIETEWASMGFGPARAAKIEGPLSNDMLGAKTDDVGVVNVTIGIFGLYGTLRMALSGALLARFGAGTPEVAMETDSLDPDWATLLQEELGRAPISLAAYLDAKDIALSSIASLSVGQILALPADARSRATLVSDGRVLYRGEIGQDENHYSLRIDEIVSEPAGVAQMATRRSRYFEVSKAQ